MPSGREAYSAIVSAVLGQLEQGVMPWRRPWVVQRPTNLFTRKPYTGINVLALMRAAEVRGFRSSSWITANQARRRGGRILDAEVDRPAYVAMMYMTTFVATTRHGERIPVRRLTGRCCPVYNLEQTRGLGRLEPAAPNLLLWNHACEDIVRSWGDAPRVVPDRAAAFYRPSDDVVAMPDASQFSTSAAYYATLFHELVHATGHRSRLARWTGSDAGMRFGEEGYAFEELVAELGSAFLCSEAGIGNVGCQDNAAYIDSWLRVLRKDRGKLFLAAFQAERACDLVLGRVTGGRRAAPGAPEDPSGPPREAPAAEPAWRATA